MRELQNAKLEQHTFDVTAAAAGAAADAAVETYVQLLFQVDVVGLQAHSALSCRVF